MAAPNSCARAFRRSSWWRSPRNLGFGGGSNAGFAPPRTTSSCCSTATCGSAADFLAPLLEGFRDPDGLRRLLPDLLQRSREAARRERASRKAGGRTAACACAIASTMPSTDLFPCFYGGGGSCAFDREKFLELGGFDPSAGAVLSGRHRPRLSWPGSADGRCSTSRAAWSITSIAAPSASASAKTQIQAVLKKNFLLFCWKNIHEWRRLVPHFFFAWAGALLERAVRRCARTRQPARSVARIPAVAAGALRSRRRARSLARIDDTEAFRRPLGGYYRDRFASIEPAPERLRVLFVSPYPICPPIHGGGVFMYQTLREMAQLAEVHVVGDAGLAAPGEATTWSCANSAPRPNGWCGPAASRATWGRCCRMPCASSPMPIWSG